MTIRWSVKPFDALSGREVHDILRLRTDVFVVEQRCAYAEIDGQDPGALHVMGHDSDALVAYARILPPDEHGLPHVGRVVVTAPMRGKGIAQQLMERALDAVKGSYGSMRSGLAAQAQLQRFYERFGFARVSEEYDWDGIPHVDMRRD